MAERKKLLLRLDPRVYDAMARWAADDLRSVNAQIEYALRVALRSAGRTPKGPDADPAAAAAARDGAARDGAGAAARDWAGEAPQRGEPYPPGGGDPHGPGDSGGGQPLSGG